MTMTTPRGPYGERVAKQGHFSTPNETAILLREEVTLSATTPSQSSDNGAAQSDPKRPSVERQGHKGHFVSRSLTCARVRVARTRTKTVNPEATLSDPCDPAEVTA